MLRVALAPHALVAVLASPAAPALAVGSCDPNGEHVNPNNGNTTAGKTGLMRCRDGDAGWVMREQELKGGVFMGVVHHFGQDGALEREYSVNERGNRDGLSRGYGRGTTGAEPSLVRERTYRNGSSVGTARTWFPGGMPERVTLRTETRFHDHGRKSSEGAWRAPAAGARGESLATGTYKYWDSDGKLRAEIVDGERGRPKRERELDASGKVVRDDEVFGDGSREAFGT